jgi:hypothetical protein
VDGLQHIRILGFPQQLGISIKDIKEKNRENYYLYIKKTDMEILYSLWEKSGDLSFEIIEKKSTDNEKISDKI